MRKRHLLFTALFASAISAGTAGASVLASTTFDGRILDPAETATNLGWTLNGVQDPGSMTALNASAASQALFDGAGKVTVDMFAPALNTGNGNTFWTTTIPITVAEGFAVTLTDVTFDNSVHQRRSGSERQPALGFHDLAIQSICGKSRFGRHRRFALWDSGGGSNRRRHLRIPDRADRAGHLHARNQRGRFCWRERNWQPHCHRQPVDQWRVRSDPRAVFASPVRPRSASAVRPPAPLPAKADLQIFLISASRRNYPA